MLSHDDSQLPAYARARDDRDQPGRTLASLVRFSERMDAAEDAMVRGLSPSAITAELMAKGLTKKQAHRYQAAVRMRWAKNDRLEGRAQRLVRYRNMLERQYQKADQAGDIKHAIAAAGVLVKLEGEEPPPPPPREPGTAPGDGVTLLSEAEAAEEMARRRREGQL